MFFFFFFQAEDGIRDVAVTGVQTCALPICVRRCLLLAVPGVAPAPPPPSRPSSTSTRPRAAIAFGTSHPLRAAGGTGGRARDSHRGVVTVKSLCTAP